MNARAFNLSRIWVLLKECFRDERGTAMTEYLLITGIMVPLIAYLFNPDAGFYPVLRNVYGLTTTILMYPGP